MSRSASTSPLELDPLVKATFLPLRSAIDVTDEPLGANRKSPGFSRDWTATIFRGAPLACAKTGGTSPVTPMSTLPAAAASSSGGPDSNEAQSMS